ncbi:MAG: electron transport complex subunit E [Oscillospiraceae bacterium]|nr:electron transport complex subunit E [Oscillospiraceae bacterium]
MSYLKEFTKGLVKENPTLVTLLGMCPTLAITTMASNAIGMGAAATFVLICSNVAIALLKKFIPKQVRLPSYIVVIAGFVTLISLILQAFVPAVYDALGIYLPLITVNCIILGRAEMFASKNNVAASALDGAGMGIGFTLALLAVGSVREILGSGKWFGMPLIPEAAQEAIKPMTIFVLPAGGFFVLGCVIALVNKIANRKPPEATGCSACPNRESCISIEKCDNTAENGEKEENK